jgi:TIR domain
MANEEHVALLKQGMDASVAWPCIMVDRLSRTFNRDQLFFDIDNIDPGLDFKKVVSEKLQACDVLLGVIGPGWLSSSNERGARRVDNPKDYVRIEIETALARDIRVIPVLVDGAPMPDEERLPDTLRPLAHRNAVRLEHERFGSDADNLSRALAKVVTPMNSRGELVLPLRSELSRFLETVYMVLGHGASALAKLDLNSQETFAFAFRFAIYVALFDFIISVPVAALIGLPYDKPAFALTSICLDFFLWLSYALLLHFSLKMLRGSHATARASISSFFLLTAYLIPAIVFMLPISKTLAEAIRTAGEFWQVRDQIASTIGVLFVVSYVAGLVVMVKFAIEVGRAYSAIHRQSRLKSFVGFGTGLAGIVVLIVYVSGPMHHVLYSAFGK